LLICIQLCCLNQYGDFPNNELGSHGNIIEEGSNVNGKYIIFENGLKVQFIYVTGGTIPASGSTTVSKYLPINIKVAEASDIGAHVIISSRRTNNPKYVTMSTAINGLFPDHIDIRANNEYAGGTASPTFYGIVISY